MCFCSSAVVFCLRFLFYAFFQDQGQNNSFLLSTEYPLRDIIHLLWYSINAQQFLNSNVSLKDSRDSECWVWARVHFPLRCNSSLIFEFFIMGSTALSCNTEIKNLLESIIQNLYGRESLVSNINPYKKKLLQLHK